MAMTTDGIGLWLFTTDRPTAAAAAAAGITGIVVDWEWRGKDERQADVDTEINRQTAADLDRIRKVPGVARICRINSMGAWTQGEIEEALDHGATDLLLPMVRSPAEAARFRRWVAGRARAGLLIETIEACRNARDLASLDPDMAYVGLNDLAIARGDRSIFAPLADGTVERVREDFAQIPFGLGGLTVVDGGSPVPCLDLLGEMARLSCSFSFLRRSFKREIAGRSMKDEVEKLQREWRRLLARTPREVQDDKRRLLRVLAERPAIPGGK